LLITKGVFSLSLFPTLFYQKKISLPFFIVYSCFVLYFLSFLHCIHVILQFARTGPPEEMGKNYDNKDLHESEIKTITEQVMRRHSELGQLVKYLKKTLPKQAVVDGKVALHANVPTAPKKDLFKSGKGLNKSKTEWPGPMSKSALPQAGTENTKYLEYKINNPTEHELKLWFVSLCQVSGAQDTEGFQHFLKSDDHRIIEFGSDGGGSCCTIV
jgi:hypothetical protein